MISALKLFVSTSLTMQYLRFFFYSKLALPSFLPSFLPFCLSVCLLGFLPLFLLYFSLFAFRCKNGMLGLSCQHFALHFGKASSGLQQV